MKHSAEETLNEICDLFGIGRDARTHATIITNVKNSLRRRDILSMIEEHHSTTEKDDDGVEIEECPLRWGADPDAYLARYVALIGTAPGHMLAALQSLRDCLHNSVECQCVDPPEDRDDDDERGNDREDPSAHSMYCPHYMEAVIEAGLNGTPLPQ